MAGWLILFVGVVYVITGVKFLFDGNLPMATVFLSYALANVGLYYSS